MKALFFTKHGSADHFWRCGTCRADHSIERAAGGVEVRVGNTIVAVVCSGCFSATVDAVGRVAPHSFPDLNERGELL